MCAHPLRGHLSSPASPDPRVVVSGSPVLRRFPDLPIPSSPLLRFLHERKEINFYALALLLPKHINTHIMVIPFPEKGCISIMHS